MAKRKECAVRKTDTKKLKRDLRSKKSGVNPEIKKEHSGMANLAPCL